MALQKQYIFLWNFKIFLNAISPKIYKLWYKNAKKDKVVKNFGVSIYSENELKFAINNNLYKYIQIPLNLADSYFFFKYPSSLKILSLWDFLILIIGSLHL